MSWPGLDDLIARGIAGSRKKLAIGALVLRGYMSEWGLRRPRGSSCSIRRWPLQSYFSNTAPSRAPLDEWFYGIPYEPEKVAGS